MVSLGELRTFRTALNGQIYNAKALSPINIISHSSLSYFSYGNRLLNLRGVVSILRQVIKQGTVM